MSVCGYICIYLAVYGPENKGDFGLEKRKRKPFAEQNLRPPIIDPYVTQGSWVCVCVNLVYTSDITTRFTNPKTPYINVFYVTSVNNTT